MKNIASNTPVENLITDPTWWMSATLESARLTTVDHPQPSDGWASVRLETAELARDDVKNLAHQTHGIAQVRNTRRGRTAGLEESRR